MPNFLFWAIRHVSVRSEVSPLIGARDHSFIKRFFHCRLVFTGLEAYFPGEHKFGYIDPVFVFFDYYGVFLIVGRTKAISQVIGYLVLENGIFLFAILLLKKMPLLVEMGILLDLFIAAVVMGIVVNNISDEFNNMDTIQLTTLKD